MPDKNIGLLPKAQQVDSDSKFVLEQQGTAMQATGKQLADFAVDTVKPYSDSAIQSAEKANQHKQEAAGSAGEALLAQQKAQQARKDIEDMTVSAVTLTPESEATAQKSATAGSFHILFGIPAGKQGGTGPKGEQGDQGPPGPQGINGVAVAAEGQFAFNVNEEGSLILYYTGSEVPDFSIHEDGHLYMNIE